MPDDPNSPESVKKHPVVFYLSTIVVAFAAGYGVHSTLSQTLLFGGGQGSDWQATARQKGWISKAECPAMPVSLRMIGPGDGSEVEMTGSFISPTIVINASYPLPSTMVVGIVYNVEGEKNYRVEFPYWDENSWEHKDVRSVFRKPDVSLDTHTKAAPFKVNLWAVVAPSENTLGDIYGSLDQIKAASPSVVLSGKVTVTAVPKSQ